MFSKTGEFAIGRKRSPYVSRNSFDDLDRGPTISGTRDRLENADRLSHNHGARIIFRWVHFFCDLISPIGERICVCASLTI